MKVAVFLTIACLIAGSQAQDTGSTDFFGNLKNALKTTLDHVKENGKNVLTGLAGQLQQAGGQLLQSTLLKLLEGLGTQAPGKRDLATIEKVRNMFQKFQDRLKEKKEQAKGAVAKGLAKLEAVMEKIKNLSFLKQSLSKTHKEIDEAVDAHAVATKRFLGDLGDLVKGLGGQLVETLKQQAGNLAQTALTQLLGNLGNLPGKRALHPAIQSLVDFFKPHVQTVVGSVKDLANTLKGHATNLWSTVQTHAGQLQGKLSGHVDELKQHGQTLLGHGKNAVDALKSAVTDILQQTMQNAKGTITDASKSLAGASGVVTNHLVDALKNAGSN